MTKSECLGAAGAAAVAAAFTLLGACAATSGTEPTVDCAQRKQKTVKLAVALDVQGRPVGVVDDQGQDATEVHVCPGDYVRWKVDASSFDVVFKRDVPFEWTGQRKKGTFVGKGKDGSRKEQWQVIDVVRDVEEARRGPPGFDYGVSTPAGQLDPRIIVDR